MAWVTRMARALRLRRSLHVLLVLRAMRRAHTSLHGCVAAPVQAVADDASEVRAPPGWSERGRTSVNVSNSV
jgi:hypothetical protein